MNDDGDDFDDGPISLRFGLVGVGKWGRTLARKFTDCGAELVAHDRGGTAPMPDRFGPRMSWRDMLADREIDAVVCAAPPVVTCEIAHACQNAGKACFLTKPVLLGPTFSTNAVTYVDYVHLGSPLYSNIGKEVGNAGLKNVRKVIASSIGDGPERGFPGSLDYGAHAAAMLIDTMFESVLKHGISIRSAHKAVEGHRENLVLELDIDEIDATLIAGNGYKGSGETSITVEFKDGRSVSYRHTRGGSSVFQCYGRTLAVDPNPDPLKELVCNFLCEASAGFVRPYFADLSVLSTGLLLEGRQAAGLPIFP